MKIIEAIAKEANLPGWVLVSFDEDSHDVLAGGRVEVGKQPAPDQHTIFPWASVTKTLTADLVCSLSKKAEVDLRSPLGDTITTFQLADKAFGERLTIEDALCHRSGLPPHTWSWVFGDCSRSEFIETRLPGLPLFDEKARVGYQYSNILYAVLGQWLEEMSSQSWEKLIHDQIFSPLDMEHSTVLGADWADQGASVAAPHVLTTAGAKRIPRFVAKDNHLIGPASETMGSVADMAKWGQYLLQRGDLVDAWTSRVKISDDRPAKQLGELGYGLGWRIDSLRGEKRVWHSGQCSGYTTLLSLLPGKNKGVALATNCNSSVYPLHAMNLVMLDEKAFGKSDVDWSGIYKRNPTKSRVAREKRVAMDAARISLMLGVYSNQGYGPFEVLHRNGGIWATFQDSDPGPIYEVDGDYYWLMPVYGGEFKLDFDEGRLSIPFSSYNPPIVFVREDP